MLRTALIGLPSAGKTTLFQLMTSVKDAAQHGKSEVQVGIAKVPDARLDRLSALFKPKKHVPATVEFTDIVGATGSAQALVDVTAYRNADALLHVVRAFRDPSVPAPHETIDPVRDIRSMEDELILADLGIAERRLERLARDLKKGKNVELERERDVVALCRTTLEHGKPLRTLALDSDDVKRLRGFQFLSAKPLLVVINLDEADLAQPGGAAAALERMGLRDSGGTLHTRLISVCAKIELEIAQLDAPDARSFLSDLGLTESGLDRVIRATYDLLGYISFFTVGEDENRAWSIARGTTAQFAAGEIHSDIQRGFIRAEVVPHDALLERGSLPACRDHGELRLEGKEYVVQDGDVINFRHAT
jgi:ribosome-binding ATPase